jgi:hypothetical protein
MPSWKRVASSIAGALFASVGCAKTPPPSEPAAVLVTPPPTTSDEPATPPKSEVPDPPWSVSYHDGSGNAFQLEQKSKSESASYAYSPVTPERSSSGMYSGGEPAPGALDGEAVARLWKRVRELEAATALHTEERGKGTGAFHLVTPAGERSFIVSMGSELRQFDELLAELKQSKPH